MKIRFKATFFVFLFFFSFGFYSYSRVQATTLKIKEIKNITVTATHGSTYTLPTTVTAIMTNNTKKTYPVKWNASKINTAKIGKQTFTGSVIGYSKKVIATVNVVARIKEIRNITQDLQQGYNYSLPKTVNATMSDGTNKSLAIKWSVAKIDTNKLGNQTLSGTVDGYSRKVLLVVNIDSPLKGSDSDSINPPCH
jgi:hypothetical protein